MPFIRSRAVTVMLCAAVVMSVSAPGQASAQPPDAPDPSQFTETTVAGIKRSDRIGGHSFAAFGTPDGLSCNVGSTYGPTYAECNTPQPPGIPGFPADAPYFSSGTPQCPVQAAVFGDGPGRFRVESDCGWGNLPVLPAGQKVTMGTSVCRVGDDQSTACTELRHGFVLQPSKSFTF